MLIILIALFASSNRFWKWGITNKHLFFVCLSLDKGNYEATIQKNRLPG